MFNSINRKISCPILLICVMIILTSFVFWDNQNNFFQRNSEAFALSMVTAGKYDFDIDGRLFGLGEIILENGNVSGMDWSAYAVYGNPELYLNNISEYNKQIGLQGWVFYFMAKLGVPRPLSALRLGCCILLAIVISLIWNELHKKYGLLFSSVFYIVSISSPWIRNFAPNLYWVTFTWFIPMLLGLCCLNNLNKRWLLYPLFFLAIFIKSACGYEFITVIMLSSIMFLIVEWIDVIKKDKQYSKLLFRTIFMIGIMSLLGFAAALTVHSYLRGGGNISNGFSAIYHQDVLRRTFGNAMNFTGAYAESLQASVAKVLFIYFTKSTAGILASLSLIASTAIFIYRYKTKSQLYIKEYWLLIISFLTCISWFVLAKGHSYICVDMNEVMWYMGFIQVGYFIAIKFILIYLFSDKGEAMLKQITQNIRSEINRDI